MVGWGGFNRVLLRVALQCDPDFVIGAKAAQAAAAEAGPAPSPKGPKSPSPALMDPDEVRATESLRRFLHGLELSEGRERMARSRGYVRTQVLNSTKVVSMNCPRHVVRAS